MAKHALITSHGTDNSVGSAVISALVAAVAAELPEYSVHETYVDVQQPQLAQVLAEQLAADPDGEFSVVPLLLGTGFHVRNDMAQAVRSLQKDFPEARIGLSRALNADAAVISVLVNRLLAAADGGLQPSDIVVFATAGSSDTEAVARVTDLYLDFAQAVEQAAPGTRTELAFLSAAEPRLKDLVPKLKFQNPKARVLVATHLLAPGFFNDLANKAGAHKVAEPLLAPNQPAPRELVQLVAKRVREAAEPATSLGCVKPFGPAWSCVSGCSKPCG